jgi:hypothetical protein
VAVRCDSEAYHLGMHRIRNEGIIPDSSDRPLAADALLREEPDEEEDEEEDDRKEDDDSDEGTDDGYSESALRMNDDARERFT